MGDININQSAPVSSPQLQKIQKLTQSLQTELQNKNLISNPKAFSDLQKNLEQVTHQELTSEQAIEKLTEAFENLSSEKLQEGSGHLSETLLKQTLQTLLGGEGSLESLLPDLLQRLGGGASDEVESSESSSEELLPQLPGGNVLLKLLTGHPEESPEKLTQLLLDSEDLELTDIPGAMDDFAETYEELIEKFKDLLMVHQGNSLERLLKTAQKLEAFLKDPPLEVLELDIPYAKIIDTEEMMKKLEAKLIQQMRQGEDLHHTLESLESLQGELKKFLDALPQSVEGDKQSAAKDFVKSQLQAMQKSHQEFQRATLMLNSLDVEEMPESTTSTLQAYSSTKIQAETFLTKDNTPELQAMASEKVQSVFNDFMEKFQDLGKTPISLKLGDKDKSSDLEMVDLYFNPDVMPMFADHLNYYEEEKERRFLEELAELQDLNLATPEFLQKRLEELGEGYIKTSGASTLALPLDVRDEFLGAVSDKNPELALKNLLKIAKLTSENLLEKLGGEIRL